MADDFGFNFGDLANFSLGGGEGGDVLQPSDYSLGAAPSQPALNTPDYSLGATGGGFTSPVEGIPAGQDIGNPSGFQQVSGAIGQGLNAVGGAVKPLLPLIGLGTAGVGMAGAIQGSQNAAQQARIARQAQRMQGDVLRSQQAAAAPLTQFGSQELQQAGAGQVPPAIRAQIDQWVQGAKAKAQDYAARSGQGNSTMLTQWLNWIDQQGKAMEADYLQKQEQLGIQSLQAGAGALTGASSTATQLQGGAQNNVASIASLMDQANKALASLTAGAA